MGNVLCSIHNFHTSWVLTYSLEKISDFFISYVPTRYYVYSYLTQPVDDCVFIKLHSLWLMVHPAEHTIAKFYTNFTPCINIAYKIAARNLRILVIQRAAILDWVYCHLCPFYYQYACELNASGPIMLPSLYTVSSLGGAVAFSWPFYWLSLPWCFKLTVVGSHSFVLHCFRTSLSTAVSTVYVMLVIL